MLVSAICMRRFSAGPSGSSTLVAVRGPPVLLRIEAHKAAQQLTHRVVAACSHLIRSDCVVRSVVVKVAHAGDDAGDVVEHDHHPWPEGRHERARAAEVARLHGDRLVAAVWSSHRTSRSCPGGIASVPESAGAAELSTLDSVTHCRWPARSNQLTVTRSALAGGSSVSTTACSTLKSVLVEVKPDTGLGGVSDDFVESK